MDTIWEQCMDLLRTKVNRHTVSTWLEPIVCEEILEDKIVLTVPNNFFIRWIKENHLRIIRDSLEEISGRRFELNFKSRDEFASDSLESSCEGTDRSDMTVTDEFALTRNLNPLYTFESFVLGSCNQFARAAALAVSENLGDTYNPLFIYGGVGLGKTHLMSAVGYDVLSRDKTKNIYFSTSEEFTNEMINALRYHKMEEFRNKYRNVDLLMIDDIQFIAARNGLRRNSFIHSTAYTKHVSKLSLRRIDFPMKFPTWNSVFDHDSVGV